ncbi:hypothetical protein SAMN04487913_11962 [Arthrobacter sp. ok362]|nr:hypothetical protein SAMN04487913_11962 [Arthrobacter sp. ok362]
MNWADHLHCPNAYPFLIVISAKSQHLSSGYLFFPLKRLINYPKSGEVQRLWRRLEKCTGAGLQLDVDADALDAGSQANGRANGR